MTVEIISQISLLFGLIILAGFLAKLIRQPLIIAYIAVGILAGPIFLNIFGNHKEIFELFSQLGIILLLFVVGLSLNFNYLKKIGKVAVVTGIGQVVITAGLGLVILQWLNFSLIPAAYLAVAITFSSTIIITKLLSDKKAIESLYGRSTIGLMLIQDIIAIFLMILLNFLVNSNDLSFLIALLIIKAGAAAILIFIILKYCLPFLLKQSAKSAEFLFVFALAWCFGLTYLFHWLGFSLEIGAVIAGLTLGSSAYSSEIASRIKPLRDFFVIIFFIILGAGLGLENLEHAIGPGLVLSLFILIGNPIILYLLFRLLKYTRRNSFLAGITSAQVSEFGFVLLLMGKNNGQVGEQEMAVFTLVAIGTIFISSYLITHSEKIFAALDPLLSFFSKDKRIQLEDQPITHDVWVVGYHRLGWKICEVLHETKTNFGVIDFNPEVISRLKRKGWPAYFGDIGDMEFLNSLPLGQAKLVVSTASNVEDQLTLIKNIRIHSQKTCIITDIAEGKYRDSLYEAGSNYVMTPHILGGNWLGHIIKTKGINKKILEGLKADQEREIVAGLPIHDL
ncbi:MAG: cation:proton antiporter [Patescibacteria group bacterium]|jgi:Kef-type K+ transport system membrane component KefB